MSDQQSQQGDHPQDNQPEPQQHNGEVVPPPHILAIVEAIDVLGDLMYDILIILVDRLRMKRHHTSTLSGAEREAAIKDFITLARYLKNIPLLNGVAGEFLASGIWASGLFGSVDRATHHQIRATVPSTHCY